MIKKTSNLIYALAIAASIVPVSQVLASTNNQDVVVTKEGVKVMSTYGDCVRTKWDAGSDKCHDQHHGKSGEMHAIMKMQERIIHFDFDRAVLKDSEKTKLDVIVKALVEHNVKAVKIVGYTDRIGTSMYNQRLSRQRAEAVKHYLKGKVKLDSSLVSLRALGEQDQIKACENTKVRTALIECLAPNRRVEIEVDYVTHVKK